MAHFEQAPEIAFAGRSNVGKSRREGNAKVLTLRSSLRFGVDVTPEVRTSATTERSARWHAALSWAVLRWSFARLGGEARARIADACARAIDRVVDCGDGGGGRDDPELVEIAGVPPRHIRKAVAYTLAEELGAAFARVEDAAA